jgi:hypothetical protein
MIGIRRSYVDGKFGKLLGRRISYALSAAPAYPEGLDGGVGRLLAVAYDRGNTGGLVEHGPKIDGVLSSRTLGRCIVARVIVSWSGIYDSACGTDS